MPAGSSSGFEKWSGHETSKPFYVCRRHELALIFAAKNVKPSTFASEVTERGAVNPVKHQWNKKPPPAVARSKEKNARSLLKKSAGKPDQI